MLPPIADPVTVPVLPALHNALLFSVAIAANTEGSVILAVAVLKQPLLSVTEPTKEPCERPVTKAVV